MKAFWLTYLGLSATACGYWLARSWLLSRRMVRASDLLAQPTLMRVNPAWLFRTPNGTAYGVHVFASCPHEAAEIVSQSPVFIKEHVA